MQKTSCFKKRLFYIYIKFSLKEEDTMKSLNGTKTLQNLINTFAGESQARNRYAMYAKAAQKEGFQQISLIFNETADNERVHAKTFYNFIANDASLKQPMMLNVNAIYPVAFSSTLDNLKAAAAGENEEHTKLYPEAADIAAEEGFPEIALKYRAIAKAEVGHEQRYLKLAKNIEDKKVFVKNGKVYWQCLECGYIHEGLSAPEICPSCRHPQAYFQLKLENF